MRSGQWEGPCPNPACDANTDGFRIPENMSAFYCRKCCPDYSFGEAYGAIMRAVGVGRYSKKTPLSVAPGGDGTHNGVAALPAVATDARRDEKADTEGDISDYWLRKFPQQRIWDETRGKWYRLRAENGHWLLDAAQGVYEEHREVAAGLAINAYPRTRKAFRRHATIRGAEIQSRGRCPKQRPWDEGLWDRRRSVRGH